MLIIKNLCKTYKPKGGVETKALDDVSLTLPETGMVFLLGKSGSGKSTLLNICGGLDTPDKGEIIIRGRSSKDFAASDFDSYRNTFVGFVFQEYNILNEFTVEENLSLALELQGKAKSKERVDELLDQVDLKGFAKRKPNTLSGGQKQRIAIARALIKDPKIIMADEPTGALDSNTGRQVLDTLKKLSESRLVIIVSHDREFAEIYGDRIIELKDGKVISDVTKEKTMATKLNDNVSIIQENTISIKNGSELSSEDIQKITDFIKNSSSDVIISNGEKNIQNFKKSNRIDDNDSSEKFDATKEENIKTREYTAEEGKFLKSKLPLRKAIRIGASSMKVKPIRLFFTLLLSIAAFTLFGVFSTMMLFNEKTVLIDSLKNSDCTGLYLNKNYKTHTYYYYDGELQADYEGYSSTYFDDTELTDAINEYGDNTLGVFGALSYSKFRNFSNSSNYFISSSVKGVAYAGENSKYRNMISGTYPSSSSEIAISDYYYRLIKSGTFYSVDEEGIIGTTRKTISSYNDIIGESLVYDYNGKYYLYKITGIYDAGTIPEDYNGFDDEATVMTWQYETQEGFRNYLNDSIQQVFLVSKDFISDYIDTFNWSAKSGDSKEFFTYGRSFEPMTKDGEYGNYFWINSYNVYDSTDKDYYDIYLFDNSKTSLSQGEIIINGESLYNMVTNYFYAEESNSYSTDFLNAYNTAENQAKKENYQKLADENYEIYQDSIHNPEYKKEMEDAYQLYQEAQKKAEDYLNEHGDDETYQTYLQEAQQYEQYYYQKSEKYYGNTDYTNADNEAQAKYDYYSRLVSIYNYILEPDSDKVMSLFNELHNVFFNTDNENLTALITKEEKAFAFEIYNQIILNVYPSEKLTNTYITYETASGQNYDTFTATIAGFYSGSQDQSREGVFISQDDESKFARISNETIETKYVESKDAKYSMIYIPIDSSDMIAKIVNKTEVIKADDSYFSISNSLKSQIDSVNYTVSFMKNIFLYVGIGLAVFAALLLFNFISVSISSKTHEIGVLRAIGARGWDVFKIFFAESAIITLICLAFSIVGSIITVFCLNNIIAEAMSFQYTLFVFGIFSLLLMIAEALLIAFIGTFFPVYNVSKKKPVESMRTL